MKVRSLSMQLLHQSLLEKTFRDKIGSGPSTFHDRNNMNVLTEKGTSGLRKHKILRIASEALDQDGLLTQEDPAVLLCSSRRTIRRDVKELKQQGIDVPTRGTLQDIGPGVTQIESSEDVA